MRHPLRWALTYIAVLLPLLLPFQASAHNDASIAEAINALNERLEALEQIVLHTSAMPTADLIRLQPCQDRLLDKKYFVICYRDSWKTAAWVGYHLDKASLAGNTKRTDDFRPDFDIPEEFRSDLDDYRNSGYDRGHMAPAGAFPASRESMSTTFLLSNMAPQTAHLNRNRWRILESEVRKVANNVGEVWVFTGNIIEKASARTIGPEKVAVPDECFKVILLRGADNRLSMYAFRMKNLTKGITGPTTKYQTTVDDIEKATGIDFFPGLANSMEDQLESTKAEWPADREI